MIVIKINGHFKKDNQVRLSFIELERNKLENVKEFKMIFAFNDSNNNVIITIIIYNLNNLLV